VYPVFYNGGGLRGGAGSGRMGDEVPQKLFDVYLYKI